jgi:hypothetical protein
MAVDAPGCAPTGAAQARAEPNSNWRPDPNDERRMSAFRSESERLRRENKRLAELRSRCMPCCSVPIPAPRHPPKPTATERSAGFSGRSRLVSPNDGYPASPHLEAAGDEISTAIGEVPLGRRVVTSLLEPRDGQDRCSSGSGGLRVGECDRSAPAIALPSGGIWLCVSCQRQDQCRKCIDFDRSWSHARMNLSMKAWTYPGPVQSGGGRNPC